MVGPINSDIAFLFFITKVTLLQVYIWHANRNETITKMIIIFFFLQQMCADVLF